MKGRLAVLCLVLLCACKEDAPPAPVSMTEDALGYFCQMNLIEHAGPKAQVHLEGLPGAPLFFSQVSDAVAYLRMPERDHRIVASYVSNMGAAPNWHDPGVDNWIDIHAALFVVGSRRMGAMDAPEFVPFGDEGSARQFVAEFGGQVMSLDDIPDAAVFPQAVSDTDADYAGRLSTLAERKEN